MTHVYVYNISNAQSTQVFRSENYVDATPAIYDNIVVWGIDNNSYSVPNHNIYVCDLGSKPVNHSL